MLNRGVGGGYNITFEGDSFVALLIGYVSTALATIENNSFRWSNQNYAVSGSTLTYPLGTNNYMAYSTRVAAVQASRKAIMARRNILITHEGLNDLNFYLLPAYGNQNAATAATSCYDGYVSYYGARVAEGWKCIINTVSPRSDVSADVEFLAARDNMANKYDTATLNGKLRSDFDTTTPYTRIFTSSLAKWDGCVLYDMGNDPNFGQDGQSDDTNYYDADKVHPAVLMYQQMADNYILNAVKVIRDDLV